MQGPDLLQVMDAEAAFHPVEFGRTFVDIVNVGSLSEGSAPMCSALVRNASMQYKKTYIDGYNVLRKLTRFERMMRSSGDAARRGFVEFVRARSRNKGHVTIVFDGNGMAVGGGPNLSAVFSQTRTADSWIRMQLELERQPRAVLVVSSDNEVRAHALACGADVQSAQEFIADGEVPDREDLREQYLKTREVTERELAYWLKQFSDD